MLKASWMALLAIGMLLPAASLADDAKFANTDGESLPEVTLSVEALHAELRYASRWQLHYSVERIAYPNEWPRSIADFNFEDDSVLARLGQLRNLSLLTLAEIGRTRLFLGVDDDGLVGIHFRAFPRDGDERYLEVVRMPYLNEDKSHSDAKQLGPKSN